MKGTMALLLALVIAASGCGDNQDPEGAKQLFQKIKALDYRKNFAKAPGYATKQPSNTKHAKFSDIFINKVMDDVIKSKKPTKEWPLDSLVVKEGYASDGTTLGLIAVMEKRGDGWYWAEYLDPDTAEGGAKYSGKPKICLDCHQASADLGDDFTFAVKYTK
jgi:hypothetical protein